jgi:exocyst complex component 3
MNDAEGVTVKLAELLRHPDDLDKIPALKSEFIRKKAAVDGQLKIGLKELLDITNHGIGSISDGQKVVGQIKEEMMKIDKLCAEAQDMIRDFPNINVVAQTHRNFTQVETMKKDLETFNERLSEVGTLLRRDQDNMEEMPNLLQIHHELSLLRNIRDDAMDQIHRAGDASMQNELENFFVRMDEVVDWFDENLGTICVNLMPYAQEGRHGLIVRAAIIIEDEERNDRKARALQDVQREHKDLASRFKSFTTGPKETRGYKEKLLQAIKFSTEAQMQQAEEKFIQDQNPKKLSSYMKWYFVSLAEAKDILSKLMPRKWRIFETYVKIYHQTVHDSLIKLIDDPNTPPPHLLAIIKWEEVYYRNMQQLDCIESSLSPQLLDNRSGDLVREWWQVIVKNLDSWMSESRRLDAREFAARSESFQLDKDAQGRLRTKNLTTMWQFFSAPIDQAVKAQREDVVESVVDAIFVSLRDWQATWQRRLDEECDKNTTQKPGDSDGFVSLQEFLIAVANDQIFCIDEEDGPGFLPQFITQFEPHVSENYRERLTQDISLFQYSSVDFATHCVAKVVEITFASEFRSVFSTFFTERWIYPDQTYVGMPSVLFTLMEYITEYKELFTGDMYFIYVEELCDTLLFTFLQSVRNKGIKFRRDAPFGPRLREDVIACFAWFDQNIPDPAATKLKWKPVEPFLNLLASEKAALPDVYRGLRELVPEIQWSWVECVLKSRDDWDRSTISSVKAVHNQMPAAAASGSRLGNMK